MVTKKQPDSDIGAALENKQEQLVNSKQQQQLIQLEKDNKRLADKLLKIETAKQELQEQLADRKRRVGFLKDERAQLQAKFEQDIAKLTTDKDVSEQRASAALATEQQYRQQAEKLAENLEAAQLEIKTLQAEVAQLNERLQTLQATQLAASSQQKNFITELDQQLAEAQEQRVTLLRQLDQFIDDRKNDAEALAVAKASVQQRFVELAKLTEQLIEEQNKNKGLKERIKKLEHKNNWLRTKATAGKA